MSSGRPPNVLRPTKLTTNLPEDIRAQLDIHLFSTVEGRIPHGAYSKFLAERVKEFFDPKAPTTRLAVIQQRIRETTTDGWSEEQRVAIETFREHILDLFL
jgi:hypothetical protein